MGEKTITKTAVIFHGSGGSENSYWIPWLKAELQKNGYEVWTPSIADHDGKPDLDERVKKIENLAPCKDFDLMRDWRRTFWVGYL